MEANRWYSPEKARRVGVLFFFFSSRRRHTRWTGDWSSDVCSSDLGKSQRFSSMNSLKKISAICLGVPSNFRSGYRRRSEERRVGKECRSRWSPDEYNKKVKLWWLQVPAAVTCTPSRSYSES